MPYHQLTILARDLLANMHFARDNLFDAAIMDLSLQAQRLSQQIAR